jgi:excisionase family DNA binding protein
VKTSSDPDTGGMAATLPGDKTVLTTGEVARICHVAPRTVSKWFDSGKLRGYRIPGSRDRRIPVPQLIAFMRAHGIPLDGLDGGVCRVLVFDPEPPRAVLHALGQSERYRIRTAENEFEAGVLAQQLRPHVIVVDVGLGGDAAREVLRTIRASADIAGAKVIATGEGLNDPGRRPAGDGCDAYLPKPYGLTELVRRIDEATNLIT